MISLNTTFTKKCKNFNLPGNGEKSILISELSVSFLKYPGQESCFLYSFLIHLINLFYKRKCFVHVCNKLDPTKSPFQHVFLFCFQNFYLTAALQWFCCNFESELQNMKILTWNINGIRATKEPLGSVLAQLDADIICLQETKVTSNDINF